MDDHLTSRSLSPIQALKQISFQDLLRGTFKKRNSKGHILIVNITFILGFILNWSGKHILNYQVMEAFNQQLISALREGDENAFERVFLDYHNKLYNYALHYVIDPEIAKELVQDTFMKLWETRSRLKPDTDLAAFLYTLTRNNSLNYLKHLLIQKKHSESVRRNLLHYQLNYAALLDKTSEQIIYNELQDKVHKAIDQLPPKCKEIFLLSRTRELKHKEIARQLNISLKTVENQISEALRRIRIDLHEYTS